MGLWYSVSVSFEAPGFDEAMAMIPELDVPGDWRYAEAGLDVSVQHDSYAFLDEGKPTTMIVVHFRSEGDDTLAQDLEWFKGVCVKLGIERARYRVRYDWQADDFVAEWPVAEGDFDWTELFG